MSEAKFDNINRILKSISPIKSTFSKMSKKLDKSFKYSSLDNLIKSLDVKYIYKDQFEPKPEIVLHKNDYNVNFQNSYDFLDELSDLNNLPLVLQNKNCLKDGDFNPDFENEYGKKEINKKYILEEGDKRKRERLLKRIELLRKFKASDSNIDPGKYHPNYDAIKKRYPCAYIRNPNIHIKNSWLINCPFRNTFEEFKRQENEKKENSKNKDSNNEVNKQNKDNNTNINTIINTNINANTNDLTNNFPNNTNNNINNTINNNINIIQKIPNINSNENSPRSPRSVSTNNDINRERNDFDLILKGKNIKVKSKIIKKFKNLALPIIPNTQRKQIISHVNSPKRKINRSISYENLISKKNPILFNKMRGRDNLFVETKYLISYSPNFKSTRPHIPSTIFKYIKDKQNYKKYINGKIIRGYYYNPRDYYVMELQREEEKEKEK